MQPSVVARDHTGHSAKRFPGFFPPVPFGGMADGGYGWRGLWLTGVMAAVVSGHYEAYEGKASRSVGAHTVRPR